MSDAEREKYLSMEKVLGWALAAMLALMSWNVWTTYQLSIDVAVIENRLSSQTPLNPELVYDRLGRLERRISDLEHEKRANQN